MAYSTQNRSSGGRPPGGERGGFQPKALPEPRPVAYYRDGKLIPELVDGQAERNARELAQVSTTQLRRFYEDVMTLRQRLSTVSNNREAAFDALRADFKMLKAKAAYANGRNPKTCPRELLQFFIDHVHGVNDARDFEAFCRHFQAVVAFHKFYGKD